MSTLSNLKKLLVGGIISITLVAAVACSGADAPADSTVATQSIASQATNVVDTATAAPLDTNTAIEPGAPEASAETSELAVADSPTAESIQATFDGDIDDEPIADAVTVVPEVAEAPAPEIVELTPAQIVEAQSLHLANLYEEAVQSVVFIVAVTNQGVGSGSGFVWDTDGHIVTNYHVIQNANTLTVKFFNGREYRADIVAFDPDADLAVIKLRDVEHELVPLAVGNSSELRPGELMIALGNPFGEEFTMTTGIVSAVTRTLNSGFSLYAIPAVVQTDAAINPGNSGGPLLDMDGAVIGVNTQIRSESGQNSGVGFAVPVDLVKRVVPSLIEDGQHTYALMGISGEAVNIEKRETAEIPGEIVGAIVMSVTSGGPAETAGIRADTGPRANNGVLLRGTENFDGDIIVSINSTRITSMDALIAYLALNTAPGEEIVVGIFRDGVEKAIAMTLGARLTNT
jgi:S1-C subfamily serine protease